jgi:hypothetical protein
MNQNMVNHLIKAVVFMTTFVVTTSLSCQKVLDLSIPKTPYTGNELRIDGYYYSTEGESGEGTKRNPLYHFTYLEICLLNRNGISIFYCPAIEEGEDTLQAIHKSLQDPPRDNYPYGYGTYIIEGNRISISHWRKGWHWFAYQTDGIILNDTTFVTLKEYMVGERKQDRYVKVFHFKKYSPKPDSTCVFIE